MSVSTVSDTMMTDSLERPGILKDVKVVLVGPEKCGKTALVHRFVNDSYSNAYIPTGFEKYSTKFKVGEFTVQYSIWDTSGSCAYDTIRPLAYQDANVFLLCFNVGDPDSLNLAINKWYPEIRLHCSDSTTPIILCGCRADARNNIETISYLSHSHKMPVTSEQALAACKHIFARAYVETSSLYANTAVISAFELAAEAALSLHNTSINTSNSKSSSSSTTKRLQTNDYQLQNQHQHQHQHQHRVYHNYQMCDTNCSKCSNSTGGSSSCCSTVTSKKSKTNNDSWTKDKTTMRKELKGHAKKCIIM